MKQHEFSAAELLLHNIDPEFELSGVEHVKNSQELTALEEEASYEFADTQQFESSLGLLAGLVEARRAEVEPQYIDLDQDAAFALLGSLDVSDDTAALAQGMQIQSALDVGAEIGVQRLEGGETRAESIAQGMFGAFQSFIFEGMSPKERAADLANSQVWDEFYAALRGYLPKDSIYQSTKLECWWSRDQNRPQGNGARFLLNPRYTEDRQAIAWVKVDDETGLLTTELATESASITDDFDRKHVADFNGMHDEQIGYELSTAFANAVRDLCNGLWSEAATKNQTRLAELQAAYTAEVRRSVELPEHEQAVIYQRMEEYAKINSAYDRAAHQRDWLNDYMFKLTLDQMIEDEQAALAKE